MFVIAVEGCSHAGKTTLIKNLKLKLGDVTALADYVTFAGGDDKVPRAPAESIEEELQALDFFLNLDERRWTESIANADEKNLIIADRSFHTLLAHRFAVENLTGIDVFNLSCEFVKSRTSILKPNVIFYLDTPQELLNQRYETRISDVPIDGHTKNYNLTEKMKLIFNKPEYNKNFREYFLPELRFGNTPIIILDGRLSVDEIADFAIRKIKAFDF